MRVIKNTKEDFILSVDREELDLIITGLSQYEEYLANTLASYDEKGNLIKKEPLYPKVYEKVKDMRTLLFHVRRRRVPLGAYSLEDAKKFTLEFGLGELLAKRPILCLRRSEESRSEFCEHSSGDTFHSEG